MMRILIAIITVLISVTGCSLSEKEEKVLNRLNSKYPEYSFSDNKDITGLYMRVEIKKEEFLDSSKVEAVYTFYESEKDKSFKEDSIYIWKYMVFYNKVGDYLFTVTRQSKDEKIIFFRDGKN